MIYLSRMDWSRAEVVLARLRANVEEYKRASAPLVAEEVVVVCRACGNRAAREPEEGTGIRQEYPGSAPQIAVCGDEPTSCSPGRGADVETAPRPFFFRGER